jgi:hypothetical protein
MKTNELTGAALDWAVATCEGRPYSVTLDDIKGAPPLVAPIFSPSTSWQEGGPIIEREWLDVTPWPNESDEDLRWQCVQHDSTDCLFFGPTPLIAAMRCYVASRLGDTINIPEELRGE